MGENKITNKYSQLQLSGILLWLGGMGFGIMLMTEKLIKWGILGFMVMVCLFALFTYCIVQIEKENKEFPKK